jgi:hypothetical protein
VKYLNILLPVFMLAAFSVGTGKLLNFFIYNRSFAPELMVADIDTIDDLKRKRPTSINIVEISDEEIWIDARWIDN